MIRRWLYSRKGERERDSTNWDTHIPFPKVLFFFSGLPAIQRELEKGSLAEYEKKKKKKGGGGV